VRFFFEDQEGREMISIPNDEILRREKEGDGITVYVSAASVALPKEKIAYAIRFAAEGRGRPVLAGEAAPPRRGRNPYTARQVRPSRSRMSYDVGGLGLGGEKKPGRRRMYMFAGVAVVVIVIIAVVVKFVVYP